MSTRMLLKCLLLALAIQGAGVRRAAAQTGEWPQFLGPARNAVSTERGLLEQWPNGGMRVVWRVSAGVGMSGIAISRGKAITLWQDDDQQFVVALDARLGKPLWKTPIAPAYRNSMGNGPRATPTIIDDQVHVLSGDGVLTALNFADGKILWQHDLPEELNGTAAEYGMACSPLVVDNLVVVTAGAPGGAIVAYDRTTGKLAWKLGHEPAGYSSPALLTLGDRRQVVAFTGESLLGITPKDGAVLWRYPFVTEYHCNIATPLAIGNRVFISSGENHGSALLEPTPLAGGYQIRETWRSLGSKSVLRCEWQTPAFVDGYLYGFDNVGSAGPVTNLVCVEAATGKRMWEEKRFGKGNLIAADGKLFIATMIGELVIARAAPKNHEEFGREAILSSTRQAPSLAGGLLYLRDNFEIVCVDVRKP